MIIQNDRDRPKPYIERALKMLSNPESDVDFDIDILEIGSMREVLVHDIDDTTPVCCNDGHSTYLFGRSGFSVTSVNINQEHLNKAAEACKAFPNMIFYCGDGKDFIENLIARHNGYVKIGLLFLDAWDVDMPGCAAKHFEIYNQLRGHLNNECMILIDDTDIYYDHDEKEFFADPLGMAGKGGLIIPEAIKDGYEVVFRGRQTLLRKKHE